MESILSIINLAILSIRPNARFFIKTIDAYDYPSDCLVWQGTMVKGEKTEEIEDEEGNVTTSVIEYEYLVPSEKPSWDEIESALGDHAAAVNEFFLSFIRERKLIELKRWRDTHEDSSVTINIKGHAVTIRREKLTTLGDKIFFLSKNSDYSEVTWVADDGTPLSLNLQDLQESYNSAKMHLVVRDEILYQSYFNTRAKIKALSDYAELAKISY